MLNIFLKRFDEKIVGRVNGGPEDGKI